MQLTLEHLSNGHSAKCQAHCVPVPEFGEGVEAWVAELTADERDERLDLPWTKRQEETGGVGFRAYAVAACLCDSERKFLAGTTEEIESAAGKLGNQNGRPITRLFDKAAAVNGLTPEAVEAIEKN